MFPSTPARTFLSRLILVVLLLSPFARAVPRFVLPIIEKIPGIGTEPPPKILVTDVHSTQCESKNKGAYLCCETIVDGGNDIVKALADAAGYTLPNSTVNGILCMCRPSASPLIGQAGLN
jgi:hypothetical protein